MSTAAIFAGLGLQLPPAERSRCCVGLAHKLLAVTRQTASWHKKHWPMYIFYFFENIYLLLLAGELQQFGNSKG